MLGTEFVVSVTALASGHTLVGERSQCGLGGEDGFPREGDVVWGFEGWVGVYEAEMPLEDTIDRDCVENCWLFLETLQNSTLYPNIWDWRVLCSNTMETGLSQCARACMGACVGVHVCSCMRVRGTVLISREYSHKHLLEGVVRGVQAAITWYSSGSQTSEGVGSFVLTRVPPMAPQDTHHPRTDTQTHSSWYISTLF